MTVPSIQTSRSSRSICDVKIYGYYPIEIVCIEYKTAMTHTSKLSLDLYKVYPYEEKKRYQLDGLEDLIGPNSYIISDFYHEISYIVTRFVQSVSV